ncbi:MAG: hypothetical protein LUH07_05230 [Lachnospiraceae bacterium]|nr:hypothetical protein [Lachnospiraceae bacterium]
MIGTRANRFYAYYKETAADRAIVLIAEDQLSFLQWDTGFISLLALERRMAGRDCLILHCAYIRYQQEALLFSAPSETGKSTQANLWEKYRGSETVNGDRALLTKADGHWVAQGWPICGSSEICENISAPIRAIVTLSQEKENRASVIHPAEAFMSIYPQITVNSWDRECITNSLNLTEALLKEVPVYHLGCTISEEAVNCLNEILYPD